jgi:hypothetical protein
VSAGMPDPFGVPLQPDPAIALQPLQVDVAPKPGPLHRVQYVIEFVGPRTMPAPPVAQLLKPEWYEALGRPLLWAMRPSDLHWQRLTPSTDGSYDSLAMAWDFLTPSGELTRGSATQLFQFAERFGPQVNRRAMPIPHPQDVEQRVLDLKQAQETLDVGFALVALAARGMPERDLWVECAKLGLGFSPAGAFEWLAPQHSQPLLSVTPLSEAEAFSLAGVHAGNIYEGVSIGFSIPLCIAPAQAQEACFHVADHLAKTFAGEVQDDGRVVTEQVKDQLRRDMRQALTLFSQLGITTGSPEAIKLFAP